MYSDHIIHGNHSPKLSLSLKRFPFYSCTSTINEPAALGFSSTTAVVSNITYSRLLSILYIFFNSDGFPNKNTTSNRRIL
jgi:hypothetical protein